MFDLVIEKIDQHTERTLAQILNTERTIMTKFDELQAAFAAMIAAQTQVLSDVSTKLQTAIDNSGADSAHFDGLIAQVNDATTNLQKFDASLTAAPVVPVAVDPASPVAPVVVPGSTVEPIDGTDPAAPATTATP